MGREEVKAGIGSPGGWTMCYHRSWAGKREGAFAKQALSSRSNQQASMSSHRSRFRQVQLQHHKLINERMDEWMKWEMQIGTAMLHYSHAEIYNDS